jgi:glycine cleavage system regulatory protein
MIEEVSNKGPLGGRNLMRSTLAFIVASTRQDLLMAQLTELFSDQQVICSALQMSTQNRRIICTGSVEGTWDLLAKTEIALTQLAEEHNWNLEIWRPGQHSKDIPLGIPYLLEASFLEDRSQTIAYLTSLFVEMDIFVEKITYSLNWLDAQEHGIARIHCDLRLPLTLNIQSLRERFYGLCDVLNVDGSLELFQR